MQQTGTDTSRIVRELLQPAGPTERQVFDLRRSRGNFETSARGFSQGTRSFGFWSFLTPKDGDLVVIDRSTYLAVYVITSVDHEKTFTGSDHNHYWVGVMQDAVALQLLTQDMADSLKAAGIH